MPRRVLYPTSQCGPSIAIPMTAPGRVAMMGPHYSLADGQDCYTAALAFERDGTHVLCVDFVPSATLPDVRPAGRGSKR